LGSVYENGNGINMTEYPNWFAMGAQDNFTKYLEEFKGKPNLKFLQLGVFTGDASLWMLENIPNIKLTDVDTWQGSDEDAHKSMDFDDVYKTYTNKIKDYKVDIRRTTTAGFLLAQYGCDRPLGEHWDFIYIDADHTTVAVLMDAELSWPLLKSGGIMAFDDYTWGQDLPLQHAPAWGIDLFLDRHDKEYETLVVNSQVWIRKL
jgi:predicted O-methyltransferase YrrM